MKPSRCRGDGRRRSRRRRPGQATRPAPPASGGARGICGVPPARSPTLAFNRVDHDGDRAGDRARPPDATGDGAPRRRSGGCGARLRTPSRPHVGRYTVLCGPVTAPLFSLSRGSDHVQPRPPGMRVDRCSRGVPDRSVSPPMASTGADPDHQIDGLRSGDFGIRPTGRYAPPRRTGPNTPALIDRRTHADLPRASRPRL